LGGAGLLIPDFRDSREPVATVPDEPQTLPGERVPMTTALLTRPVPAHAAADTRTWELDRARCALAVTLDLPGATIWRARLRPLAARLSATELSANLSVRPALASLPLTRALFLRGVSRTARIWLDVEGDLSGPDPLRVDCEVSVGSRTWPAQLWLRRTELPGDRLLVAVAGRIVTRERTFPGTKVQFEAVGEFVPCG